MSNRLYALPNSRRKTLHDLASNSQTHKMLRQCGSVALGLMLLLVVFLLSACHTLPPKPCAEQTPPTMPAVTLPTHKTTYSISASESIELWRKMLIEPSATVKP